MSFFSFFGPLIMQIPDALMDYYMTKAGVECDDIRLYVFRLIYTNSIVVSVWWRSLVRNSSQTWPQMPCITVACVREALLQLPAAPLQQQLVKSTHSHWRIFQWHWRIMASVSSVQPITCDTVSFVLCCCFA